MLKQLIMNEINYETKTLNKILSKISNNYDYVLLFSKGEFSYYRKHHHSRRKYIKRYDYPLLRNIAGTRYLIEKSKILKSNILILEKVLNDLEDYDDDSIMKKMPKAHALAVNRLREAASEEVKQSENPKHRDGLMIRASNGILVRTKGELNILEALADMELNVRYEKALELKEKELQPDGSVIEKTVTVYPDFTIILPDDSEIYIELAGLYDKAYYRKQFKEKLDLYYDNGIYMPKNLIVIMESATKPLDMTAIRRIIESQILPLA